MKDEPTMDRDGESGGGMRRRGFLSVYSVGMAGGLAAGYGAFGYLAGGFLFPTDDGDKTWQYVAPVEELEPGDALVYQSPAGAKVVVARRGEGQTAEDFVALSSICPHLGCLVHWEPHRERFFCPCHNGVFDPQGRPQSGPPAAANQPLERYPLKVEGELLFIGVPMSSVGSPAGTTEA